MNQASTDNAATGWDTYWKGAQQTDSIALGGINHPGLRTFWSTALSEFIATYPDTKILDIASGSGGVIDTLSHVPGANLKDVHCVDISAAAIDGIKARFPDVEAVVADAASMPFESGSFGLITSQFGIEYAGPAAVDEAVRLLAPGGSLLFLLQNQSGALHTDCLAAIDALQRTQESRFIELARTFFKAGFAAVRGADRTAYNEAAAAMNPAIAELDATLSQHGEHVAGDTIVYLYDTVQAMHKGIQSYQPDEVMNWLDAMESELQQQLARMTSMREAALDEQAFQAICDSLTEKGLTIDRGHTATVEGEDVPLAWVLQASQTAPAIGVQD